MSGVAATMGSTAGQPRRTKAEIKKSMSQLEEKQKRLEKDEKNRQQEDFIASGNDPSSMIIMPKYKVDDRL